LPLLGLIVGSIAPDFGYYVGRLDVATFAHSWGGVFLFCAPASATISLLVIRWRRELTAPLPPLHRDAIDALPAPDAASLTGAAMLVLATLVGAMTHVVWDSFTHASGTAVNSISALRTPIGAYGVRTVFLYNVLQHASTVIGLLAMAAAYMRWIRNIERTSERAGPARAVWLLSSLAVIAVLLGSCGALWASPPTTPTSYLVVRIVVYATTAFAALFFALGVILVRAK
jgi:hypothetical protein